MKKQVIKTVKHIRIKPIQATPIRVKQLKKPNVINIKLVKKPVIRIRRG